MPRPGPRPYDCPKRAWHSEIHQPIRGTLIQEIFRVVNEIHASSTKKNKEYQEKLPVVVLRVEEIIYSKANSVVTFFLILYLLKRKININDSVQEVEPWKEKYHTRIKKNKKKNFTGEYIIAEYMDLTTLLVRTNDAIDTIIRRDEHAETGEYLRPCIEAALSLGCSLTKASRSERNNQRCYLSRSAEEVPNTKSQCVEHEPAPKLFSVYPLYFGNNIQSQVSHASVSHTGGPALVSGAQNLLNSSSGGSQSFIIKGDFENPCTNKCDLSLRLGPLNVPSPSLENDQILGTRVRNKVIVRTSSQKDKKLEFRGQFCENATNNSTTTERRI
ncbi:hypothetical protein CR513_62328, partial [Mucuna pruriens]